MSNSTAHSATPEVVVEPTTQQEQSYLTTCNEWDLLSIMDSLVTMGLDSASNGVTESKHFENIHTLYRELYNKYKVKVGYNV